MEKIKKDVTRKLQKLRYLGYSDQEIATMVGAGMTSIPNWRKTGSIREFKHRNALLAIPEVPPNECNKEQLGANDMNVRNDRVEQLTIQVKLAQSDIGEHKYRIRLLEEKIEKMEKIISVSKEFSRH